MIITRPVKCCATPIWRHINGEWVCLNDPLHDAIYINRDDNERVRLLKLIDSSKQASAAQLAKERGIVLMPRGGGR